MSFSALTSAIPSLFGGGGSGGSKSEANSSVNVAISPNIIATSGGSTRAGAGASASGSAGGTNPFTSPPRNDGARYDIDQPPVAAITAGTGDNGLGTLTLIGIAGLAVLVFMTSKGKGK